MAKRPRSMCDNEIEELVFDSDSQEQYTTGKSEINPQMIYQNILTTLLQKMKNVTRKEEKTEL
jgi:hypothetical protein